jgi:hypothetical protein
MRFQTKNAFYDNLVNRSPLTPYRTHAQKKKTPPLYEKKVNLIELGE